MATKKLDSCQLIAEQREERKRKRTLERATFDVTPRILQYLVMVCGVVELEYYNIMCLEQDASWSGTGAAEQSRILVVFESN